MTLAIASVFNWDRLDYDYYRTPEKADLGGWHTLSGLGVGGSNTPGSLGIDIEDALPVLPQGSKKIGKGHNAKGRIMRIGSALGSTPTIKRAYPEVLVPLFLIGAAVLLVRRLT